jgi:transcriptional regulator with XRE-family HTH domain
MEEPKRQSPFLTLGIRLKLIRESNRESLAEVSGAVEIDTELLERIERGEERPSEDILMLLINHFNIQDPEAVQLWESAGYSQPIDTGREHQSGFSGGDMSGRQTMVLLAIDARVLYSDSISISGNDKGLVMHFAQAAGQQRPMPIARVGMGYEQAEEVLRVLQQALLRRRYMPSQRLLPPGNLSADQLSSDTQS